MIFAAVGLSRTTAFAAIDTEIGDGIGTSVADVFGDGSGLAIETSIESVNHEDPVFVVRDGLGYYEVLGTVQGRGWGGEFQDLDGELLPPPEPLASFSHYSYSIPFVLRWPKHWDGTLVQYAHGFSLLSFSLLFDRRLGDENEARRADISEGRFVSDASVDRRHAFFAVNLTGLDRTGAFSAIASEGPFEGSPVNPSVDVPISRDLTLLAKRLLARLARRSVSHTIGSGHSGGALIAQYIASNRGFSLLTGTPLFDGGNFVTAYVPSSGTIFDGVIPLAGGGFFPVHPAFPLTAKAILIGGDTDYASVDNVRYADRVLRNGVDINAMLRVYQFRNLSHAFAEIVEAAPNQARVVEELFGFAPGADGEHMAPIMAAAIENMDAWLRRGTPPPLSRVNGQALDEDGDTIADRIAFSLANGGTTSVVPFVEDSTLDVFLGDVFELSAGAGQAITVQRYAEVLAALDHVDESIALPYLTCRVGGYEFAADAVLFPFPDIEQHFKNFNQYRSCVRHAIKDLSRTGLYDRKLGEDTAFTTKIRDLFGR